MSHARGLFITVTLLLAAACGGPAPAPALSPAAPVVEPALDHTGWHPVDSAIEVKWIRDATFFSTVGGTCYARHTDGSLRTPEGKPGLIPVAESYCIRFGAKRTGIGVPDPRDP